MPEPRNTTPLSELVGTYWRGARSMEGSMHKHIGVNPDGAMPESIPRQPRTQAAG
jgi:hypothetical protein